MKERLVLNKGDLLVDGVLVYERFVLQFMKMFAR